MGRLTADPEVRYTQDGMPVAKYTVAIDRYGKEKSTDFIPCTAFGKAADLAAKYFTKGIRIALTGSIQTGSYTNKDGRKVYTWGVIVDRHEFADGKTEGKAQPKDDGTGFMDIPEGDIPELLFN